MSNVQVMIYEVYERLPVQSACLLIDINLVLAAQMVLDGGERRPQPLLLSDDRVDHHLPVQRLDRILVNCNFVIGIHVAPRLFGFNGYS